MNRRECLKAVAASPLIGLLLETTTGNEAKVENGGSGIPVEGVISDPFAYQAKLRRCLLEQVPSEDGRWRDFVRGLSLQIKWAQDEGEAPLLSKVDLDKRLAFAVEDIMGMARRCLRQRGGDKKWQNGTSIYVTGTL